MNPPASLQALLLNPLVTDILINGPEKIYIDQGSGLVRTAARFPGSFELRAWVQAELTKIGRSWDARHPFVDATFESGHRAQVTFPPVTSESLLVSLRRISFPARHGGKSEALSRWSGKGWEILVDQVKASESILVTGATGSGKTTLVNDLLSLVPENERIIALEDTPELRPDHPHFLSLLSRPSNADGFGEVTLRDLLKQALRMRPDRILLGECRGGEVLELLQALNTGHRGTLATLHANSSRDALRRIELLCLLGAGGGISPVIARDLVAGGISWIVHVGRDGNGVRRIREISSIEGKEGDAILLRPHAI